MLTVQASGEAIKTYRELLVSEWTRSFPQEVLSLLWAVLAAHDANQTDPIIHLLDPLGTIEPDMFQSIVQRIGDGTKFIKLAELPDFPADYIPPKNPASLVRQANQIAICLTLPAHTMVAGDTEFFADVAALAFQAAIHFVLPSLRIKHEAEHALLLHTAVLFSIRYSAYEPAHYSYMMSMVHGYLGDANQRLRCLFAAFRFTSPKDHSYLTKAQEYWTELLDRKMYKDAEDFLFSLHWWSLPTQQDEVREMLVDAVKFILSAKRKKAARGRSA